MIMFMHCAYQRLVFDVHYGLPNEKSVDTQYMCMY